MKIFLVTVSFTVRTQAEDIDEAIAIAEEMQLPMNYVEDTFEASGREIAAETTQFNEEEN